MAEKGNRIKKMREGYKKKRAMSESSPLEMWIKRKRETEEEKECRKEEVIFRKNLRDHRKKMMERESKEKRVKKGKRVVRIVRRRKGGICGKYWKKQERSCQDI